MLMGRWLRRLAAMVAVVAVLGSRTDARAFCGFYVSGADARLTNNATQVVLMRDGTRTVLSMQNGYQGPPKDFAMVVPVPVVLHKENVKTLPHEVFDHVDQLTAPRLVEYWEQDPCSTVNGYGKAHMAAAGGGLGGLSGAGTRSPPLVKIEAQFSVGEYDIVVLSATDSTALDAWLHQNGYKIPDGAEPYLRPYVQLGMKFFVAKVDVSRVRFERIGNGPEQAILSPLRFHYDSDAFNLPIRLGLINSGGTQDLIVTVLARGQRFEVANYNNVAIPTNIDVSDATRGQFGAFYTTLFDQTLAKHPRSVITEYAWASHSCDPCPTPPLSPSDLLTLGADVLPSLTPPPSAGGGAPIVAPTVSRGALNDFVITRLHARYSKEALGDDLFFRAAPPIVGGREFMQSNGKLEQGAQPSGQNNFQARYVVRHAWTGPITCAHPARGNWGGPPGGAAPEARPAAKIGFAARGKALTLASLVRGVMPTESVLSTAGPINLIAIPATVEASAAPPSEDGDASRDAAIVPTMAPEGRDAETSRSLTPTVPPRGGCAGCDVGAADGTMVGSMAALAMVAVARLRRRARRMRR
jgi:hypothetical protein